ncbi:hypothetical protein PRBRB14_25350 [Hallella multisaccharivorax DSM 17128]|nr:hypothetical protein PRBRB14_25350 [Hallella multisaccharivorax DSM 17128]
MSSQDFFMNTAHPFAYVPRSVWLDDRMLQMTSFAFIFSLNVYKKTTFTLEVLREFSNFAINKKTNQTSKNIKEEPRYDKD